MNMFRHGKSVGEFTKRYREDHSLTQDDLAHRLGFHPQYVSNIERGTHKGAISFVKSFSKIIKDRDVIKHLYNLAVDERIELIIDKSEGK